MYSQLGFTPFFSRKKLGIRWLHALCSFHSHRFMHTWHRRRASGLPFASHGIALSSEQPRPSSLVVHKRTAATMLHSFTFRMMPVRSLSAFDFGSSHVIPDGVTTQSSHCSL